MKKIFAVILALAMLLALAACGGKTEPATTGTDAVETTLAADDTAVTPSDAAATARMFDLMLGDDLAGRKRYIAEHGAEYLKDADI